MTRWKVAPLVLLVLGTIAGTGVVVRHTVAAPVPAPFAHRLWTVMDLVRDKHPEPPSRPEMMLAAVKGVLAAAKSPVPDDLERRVRRLETREQFTAFLKDAWPRGADVPGAEVLEAAALNGLFAAVPGEGAFWPPEEARVADQVSGNRYVGTGIQIRLHPEEKVPQIAIAFRGGPAQRAGVKSDDLIVEVDGKSTHNLPLSKVIDMLRGDEGTTVTMTVRAPGASEKRALKMTRSVVPFENVFGYRRASEDAWEYRTESKGFIGYVWVDSCNSSTVHELRQVERRLRSQGVRALVIDFRFSRGGSEMHNATLLGDALLDGALLWRLRGADKQVREYRAGRDCLFRDWPLAVLVNDSVDAGEGAVAAALQDNGRAVVVGEATRNGGFVTSRVAMPDGQGALSFRTGQLERAAKGRGWPVEPDHAVPLTRKQGEAVNVWLREKGRPAEPRSAADKAPDDPQLDKAVELLRAALKKADAGRDR